MRSKLVQVDVDSYKRLIAKKAIESWRKFPAKTKAYIDIEDMIQDGVMYARFSLLPRYNPRKAKFSTVLFKGLENFYRRCAEQLNAEKRYDGGVLMLDELREGGFDAPDKTLEDTAVSQHVRTTFLAVYNSASIELRASMRRWFLQTEMSKVHLKSSRFHQDRKEFLKLAKEHGLDIQDCRTLLRSTLIKNEVVSGLPEYNYMELQ